ncbi:MAG: CHC2 zinc finger domain-containing protein [Gammaproteobacteria bacterium]
MNQNIKATWSNRSKMAYSNIQQHNNTRITPKKPANGKFNKTKLPSPISVLNKLGITHDKATHAGFLKIRCPFHKNGAEKNPSLNLHQLDGYFKCHSCGAKGGDILAFFMKVTNMSFIDAAKVLNAWEV